MFDEYIYYKWWFSIAIWIYQRVYKKREMHVRIEGADSPFFFPSHREGEPLVFILMCVSHESFQPWSERHVNKQLTVVWKIGDGRGSYLPSGSQTWQWKIFYTWSVLHHMENHLKLFLFHCHVWWQHCRYWFSLQHCRRRPEEVGSLKVSKGQVWALNQWRRWSWDFF